MATIERFALDDVGDVKKLPGLEGYRLRVGNFRVLFEKDGDTMIISRVGSRVGIFD